MGYISRRRFNEEPDSLGIAQHTAQTRCVRSEMFCEYYIGDRFVEGNGLEDVETEESAEDAGVMVLE